jgi:hypothetical protein
MPTCEQQIVSCVELELPPELEELAGLIHADLDAIARMISTRAHERLFLARGAHRDLYHSLRNGLTREINIRVAALTAETR